MAIVLLSDIGGTNSRLHLVQTDPYILLKGETYSTKDFPSLLALLSHFLEDAPLPQVAVLGTAGYIINNTAYSLNAHWAQNEVSGDSLAESLGIHKLVFLNDFVVAGYGCLELRPEDVIYYNQAVDPLPKAPISVFGPGTGIGECFITWNGKEYTVWPSEGGASDYPAKTELQWRYSKYMEEKINEEDTEFHMFKPILGTTTEICFSGVGVHHLYFFLKEEFPDEVNEEFDLIYTTEKEERVRLLIENGFEKKDKICERAVDMWLEAMATEIGTMIAKTLPYGGFYIIGGMVSRNAQAIAESPLFREALYSKAPHICEIISKVPLYIVKNLDVGMLGALSYAKRALLDL